MGFLKLDILNLEISKLYIVVPFGGTKYCVSVDALTKKFFFDYNSKEQEEIVGFFF